MIEIIDVEDNDSGSTDKELEAIVVSEFGKTFKSQVQNQNKLASQQSQLEGLDFYTEKVSPSGGTSGVGSLMTGGFIYDTYNEWHTQNISNFRDRAAKDIIRVIFDFDPICSNALFTLIRVADTDHYFIVKKANGSDYKEGQSVIEDFIRQIEHPVNNGFIEHFSIGDIKRKMVKSLFTQGAIDCLLNIERSNGTIRPTGIEMFEPFNISFRREGDTQKGFKIIPQYLPTNKDLNYPNFYHIPLDTNIENIRGSIPILSVLSTIFFIARVLDDLQKVLANQGHPRIKAKIIRDVLLKNMPPDVVNDRDPQRDKARAWVRARFAELKKYLEDLQPDDSIIVFDYVDLSYLELQNTKLLDPTPLIDMLQARLIAGLKTLPTLVGMTSGAKTQGYADTETLIYLKVVATFQNIISDTFGRIFTQVLNLLGYQGYVEFHQQPPNLRNPNEMSQWQAVEIENLFKVFTRGDISESEYHRKVRRVLGFYGDPPKDAVMNLDLLTKSGAGNPALIERPTSSPTNQNEGKQGQ